KTGGLAPLALTLTARFGTPGAYDGTFMPTVAGTYTFHIKGKIDTQNVDEKFESGPGRFDDVDSATALQYPVKVPTGDELSRRLDDLRVASIRPGCCRRQPSSSASSRSAWPSPCHGVGRSAPTPRRARRRVRPDPDGRRGGGARELREVEPRIRRSAHQAADGGARHVQRDAGRARERRGGARCEREPRRRARRDAGERRGQHAARVARRDRRRRLPGLVD